MRKILLYIATSIDGFIARENGEIDWLVSPDGTDYGYEKMYASIDTVLMGNTTFEVSRKLEEKPFSGKRCVVFTRQKKLTKYSNIEYVTQPLVSFVEQLKKEKGKDIWVVGGGEIVSELLNNNLIDEMQLFIHPIILGKGISLYSNVNKQINLNLKETKKYSNGMTELIYTRK